MSDESYPPVERPHWIWWVLVIVGMTITGLLALNGAVYGWWADNVVPVPQWVFLSIFGAAVAAHAFEAVYAQRRASENGENPVGWWMQTLLLGYPSLGLLIKKTPGKKKTKKKKKRDPRL